MATGRTWLRPWLLTVVAVLLVAVIAAQVCVFSELHRLRLATKETEQQGWKWGLPEETRRGYYGAYMIMRGQYLRHAQDQAVTDGVPYKEEAALAEYASITCRSLKISHTVLLAIVTEGVSSHWPTE